MRVLVFGPGVVGTLHGWALAQAGHDVSVLVRSRRAARRRDGVRLNVLDGRGGQTREVRTWFAPPVVTDPAVAAKQDVVLLTVRHNQVDQAVEQLAPHLGNALLIVMTGNWRGFERIDDLVDPQRYVLAMSQAGGRITGDLLDGALAGGLLLGGAAGDGHDQPVRRAVELFRTAEFDPRVEPDLLHRLWVRFAVVAALGCGGADAGGFRSFARDTRAIRRALLAGREALQVCRARGVDPARSGETAPFRMPAWLSAPVVRMAMSREMNRRIMINRGYHEPRHLAEMYDEVIETAATLGVPTPRLAAYRDDVRRMAAQEERGGVAVA